MSYILDALKKAEVERQLGQVPNAQQLLQPEASEPQRPARYRLLIVAGVVLNLLLVGYLYLDRQSGDETTFPAQAPVATATDSDLKPLKAQSVTSNRPASATASTASASSKPARAATPAANSAKPAQNKAVQDGTATTVSASAPGAPDKDGAAPANHLETVSTPFMLQPYRASPAPEAERVPLPSTESGTVRTAKHASAPVTEATIPRRRELPRTLQIAIPELELAALVYSEDPAGRMVFVNSRLMREGQAVDESLQLLEIRRREVVFAFNEVVFRVEIF